MIVDATVIHNACWKLVEGLVQSIQSILAPSNDWVPNNLPKGRTLTCMFQKGLRIDMHTILEPYPCHYHHIAITGPWSVTLLSPSQPLNLVVHWFFVWNAINTLECTPYGTSNTLVLSYQSPLCRPLRTVFVLWSTLLLVVHHILATISFSVHFLT